jgi:regulator of nucleoside diphosphate kinase
VIGNRRTFSAADAERLIAAIDRAASCWLTDVPHLGVFRSVVRRGHVVPPADVPADVITMDSRFAVEDVNTGQSRVYALVYPAEEAIRRGRVSVLSPAGMALLGARVGEEACWMSTAGPQVAKVRRLFHQPETAIRASLRSADVARSRTAVLSHN